MGRWGNSTGSDPSDWHVSNLTDNSLSGFTDMGDWRQSADPHGSTNVESNQGVPYGTIINRYAGRAEHCPRAGIDCTAVDRSCDDARLVSAEAASWIYDGIGTWAEST